jgi:hypothetical protein
MATAPSPNDLTRQQLDELDALLQKMLALPLNPPGPSDSTGSGRGSVAELPLPDVAPLRVSTPPPYTAPAAATYPVVNVREGPALWRAEGLPEAGPQLLTATLAAAPVVETPPAPVAAPRKASPPPAPAPQPPKAAKTAPTAAPAVKTAPAVPVLSAATPAPTVSPVVATVDAPTPVPSARRNDHLPLLFVPLVSFNEKLNDLLGHFGLPGRILRSGFGKNIFGLTGIGLLSYTAAMVMQTHGWVSLPITLPWPR